ncbi:MULTISPECIES: SDR family oxidoreductase [unclassified Ruegeria]|uniref:SDR family NAD(P)-dependent oxidoreductase n=1 Tax=unclassified Ruegeria TaxID=2625375 RepID=UPI001488CE3E|nr:MULTISPECIES: SDR family NAD(P)-dependent oxidoreductase [unclassified Ruegeria]
MTQTAVITGGAGGLGRALSAALRAQGWHTVLIDLPGPELDSYARLDGVTTFACDLTQPDQIKETCTQVIESCASIDLVIYNAGVSQISAFAECDMASHRNLFEINYFAAVDCARQFLHPLRQSKGTHLAISSVAGFAPLFHRTAYAASKHALEGFFKSLGAEEIKHGVSVSIAAPSFVATNIGRPDAAQSGFVRPGSASDGVDYMEPEDAARVILRGYARGKRFIPVGRVARLANIVNRIAPGFYFSQMLRTIAKDHPT